MKDNFAPLPPPLTGVQLANQQRALDALHGVTHTHAPATGQPHPAIVLQAGTPIHVQPDPVGVIVQPASEPTPVHKAAHFSPGILLLVIILGAIAGAVAWLARGLNTPSVCNCSGQAHVHVVNNEPQPWEN